MSSIKRDPRDGRWLARWRDPAGRQRKKSFPRRVDAERFLSQLTAGMHRGSYVDPAAGKLRFGAYAETWMQGLAHLKRSTSERYRETVRAHVLPQWESWPLASVTHSDVAAWVGDLSASGMSAGTVRKVHLVTSLILAAAVADGRIARNPAVGVKLPRQTPREPRFLAPDELVRLADAAGDDGLAIMVLGLTGLRFGEFAALRVRRLDPVRSRLVIAESVTVVRSELVWSTPKTHRTRSVPVPPALMAAMVDRCAGKGRDDLVFTSPTGGTIRLSNWRRRVFAPACAAAGITDVTPHDLRHTAASLAIAAGANVKAVQQMLGHASAAMTLDVYAGLFPDDLDAVGAALGRLVPQTCHNGPISALPAAPARGSQGG